jgi:hypothetical protein
VNVQKLQNITDCRKPLWMIMISSYDDTSDTEFSQSREKVKREALGLGRWRLRVKYVSGNQNGLDLFALRDVKDF